MNLNKIQSFTRDELMQVLATADVGKIDAFLGEYGLQIVDKKIVPIKEVEKLWKMSAQYWDKQQLVKKISLNSAYGALLNAGSRFFDQRLGQSTTLTGRTITRHMASKTNELITGEYDHYGASIIYGDTDSFLPSTTVITSAGEKTVGDLFNDSEEFWNDGEKEYAYDPELMVMSYDNDIKEPYMGHTEYIYRHKVTKDLYEIEDANGNLIVVTEDHSIMVERDGELIDVRPMEILETDVLISIICKNNEYN